MYLVENISMIIVAGAMIVGTCVLFFLLFTALGEHYEEQDITENQVISYTNDFIQQIGRQPTEQEIQHARQCSEYGMSIGGSPEAASQVERLLAEDVVNNKPSN